MKTGDGETHRGFESHSLRQNPCLREVWIFLSVEMEGCVGMAVQLNEDQEMVKLVRDGLKRTGGYCPCRLERTEENKCICREFREQIADPEFKGYCHCMLYYKE